MSTRDHQFDPEWVKCENCADLQAEVEHFQSKLQENRCSDCDLAETRIGELQYQVYELKEQLAEQKFDKRGYFTRWAENISSVIKRNERFDECVPWDLLGNYNSFASAITQAFPSLVLSTYKEMEVINSVVYGNCLRVISWLEKYTDPNQGTLNFDGPVEVNLGQSEPQKCPYQAIESTLKLLQKDLSYDNRADAVNILKSFLE